MTDQPDLLAWRPPDPPDVKGATFNQERDGRRLSDQQARVYAVMKDGQRRGLAEIAALTGDPEASTSARLRDLRRFGFNVQRVYVRKGLWHYWIEGCPRS